MPARIVLLLLLLLITTRAVLIVSDWLRAVWAPVAVAVIIVAIVVFV
jgi:hypothetical protein